MENNNIDITKMSVMELESLAYRVLVEIERGQNNLKAINQEIAKKSQQPMVEEAEVKSAE